MKRTLYILLLSLLALLTVAAGVVGYLYTASGNARVKTYIEKRLQAETKLPITFQKFLLERGHLYFVAMMGKEASLGFDGRFDILRRSLDGRYLLKAQQAHYQKYTLRQARIAGQVRGTIDNLDVSGKGTLLDGPTVFKLKIRAQMPQDIVVQLRKIPLGELLPLVGQPAIVQGALNADILMPSIGRKGSRGHALVRLSDARFVPQAIQKLYHYTLPKDKAGLQGEARVELEGEKVAFSGKILSDLITVHLKNGQANITEKNAACDLAIDTAELAPVTQNRLHGPLKLSGTFKQDALGMQLRAQTASLGGAIAIDYTKSVAVTLKNVWLSRLLHFAGQPNYAEGIINGTLKLKTPKAEQGTYTLKLSKGKLHARILNKNKGTSLPTGATFRLDSHGTFAQGVLDGTTQLKSNLLDVTLSGTRLSVASGHLKTRYRLHIPNPLRLAGKPGKGVPVTVDGTMAKDAVWHIDGEAKGLGKRLSFDYAGTKLKLAADDVALDRLLSSAGLPTYASGGVNARIDLVSLDPMKGTVQINAPQLTTHGDAMQKLIGKPLATTAALAIDGRARKGIFSGKAQLKSPILSLALPQMRLEIKHQALTSPFDIRVPDMAALQPFIGTKLNGAFATSGTIRTGAHLDIGGTSKSLGGTVAYRYLGTRVEVKAEGVSLPKLLHMADQPEQFLGDIHGTLSYDTVSRKGQTHMTVDQFQFRPSKLSAAVKLVLRKDLAQIIYEHTALDARFNGDRIAYRLKAAGKRSDFVIRDGKLNTRAKTNKASFGLRMDKIDVIGTVRGQIDDPKITVLPGKMLRNRLKKKVFNKVAPAIKKGLKKATGGAVGDALKKLPKLF